MSFATDIPDADALFEYIIGRCSNPDSPAHGPAHWAHVAETGLRLASSEPQCDLSVLFLFSLFHDSMRVNEYEDPMHGPRAALLAATTFSATKLFNIDSHQLALLIHACSSHTSGDIHGSAVSPTVATCWNADRLNLMRVGEYPDAQYLSGKARDPHVIAFESERVLRAPMTWAELHAAYVEFEGSR